MYTIFFTAVSILIPSHNFNCETEIYYRLNSYIEESGKHITKCITASIMMKIRVLIIMKLIHF